MLSVQYRLEFNNNCTFVSILYYIISIQSITVINLTIKDYIV